MGARAVLVHFGTRLSEKQGHSNTFPLNDLAHSIGWATELLSDTTRPKGGSVEFATDGTRHLTSARRSGSWVPARNQSWASVETVINRYIDMVTNKVLNHLFENIIAGA